MLYFHVLEKKPVLPWINNIGILIWTDVIWTNIRTKAQISFGFWASGNVAVQFSDQTENKYGYNIEIYT